MEAEEQPRKDGEWRRFVRKHVHDFRNHLNGIEMSLMMLEEECDSAGRVEVENIRRELVEMQNGLRFLSNRFVEPVVERVSALDVFTRWKARHDAGEGGSVNWDCLLEEEWIEVDMRILPDTLGEWLEAAQRSGPARVTARRDGDDVVLSVETASEDDREHRIEDALPAGFVRLIERNGGRFCGDASADPASAAGSCRFPVVETSAPA